MKPEELSQQLRRGRGTLLARRRGVAALSLTAIGSMGPLTLYQMGLIEHLPEPPLPGLDAEKVASSALVYAYFSNA